MVRRVLEEQGYTVLAASTGEEALHLARQYNADIDLVFTDVVMPGMNGSELVERLRASRSGIRVIFMSGYAEGAVRRGLLDPTTSYLQKPFSPATLTELVRRVLEEPAATI